MYPMIRKLLFKLKPEVAHSVTLRGLRWLQKSGLAHLLFPKLPDKPVNLMGLRFPNPVGLAAGLDKNGEYIDALASLGFGFIEVGTVTPRGQPGNPKPRLFRLPSQQALINRLGFNNYGVDYLLKQLQHTRYQGILGINIGKNADTPLARAVNDYLTCLRKVYRHASYIVVNISSPNTLGLRELQGEKYLKHLLSALKETQLQLNKETNAYKPLVVKVAPDLDPDEISSMAKVFLDHKIDGVIATNATISRHGLHDCPHAKEKGGLSGQPLFKLTLHAVDRFHQALGNKIPIIAVGGIMNAANAQTMLDAGASLLQLYTGLIYRGPRLVREVVNGCDLGMRME